MSTAPRTIVVTGVSRGLGRALVERFLESGHRVAGCARSGLDELREGHPEAFLAPCDVADPVAVDAFAREALERLGPPDLLVNNAALMNDLAPLWEVSVQEFERLLAVNVRGTFHVLRAFLPAMVAAGRGVVVNLSSGWGRSTAPEVGPYCTSKWAVEGLTGSLAQELPRGLAAVSLNPGVIDTDMLRQCWAEGAAAHEGAEAWSRRAAPFLLKLDARSNGARLTVP